MKKLQAKHYIILMAICVIVIAVIVAFTIGIDAAIGTLIAGAGGVVGLMSAAILRKKTSLVRK